MSALWTREQHEWLQAMGHTVWSMADATAPAATSNPETSQPVDSTPPAARRSHAAQGAASDRLMQALLRVVGDADALQALGIEPATLRGNAAAKRALWPRLRALHRGRRP
jgi:hypothetical protein